MTRGTLWSIPVFAAKEIHDARRNRWFFWITVVFAGLAVMLSWMGLAGLGTLGIAGFGRTTASLLNLVMLIVPVMGLVLGAVSIAGEKEQGTLSMILAQPVNPWEVLLGKWVGMATVLTAAILIGFGLSGLLIAGFASTQHLGVYLKFVGWTVLLGLVFLSWGTVLSVWTRRSASALSLAIFVWLVVVFLSDLGWMGLTMIARITPMTLFWLTVINPVQAFRLAAFQGLQGDLDVLGPAGRYAIHTLGHALPGAMAAILIGWAVVAMVVAFWQFPRRSWP